MALIVGVIQVKGGVGRSTIATNLAAAFSTKGPTLLIDCDLPQATSASWFKVRQDEIPSSTLALATVNDYRELVACVKDAGADSRYIVIDGPPRLAAMTRAIMILSRMNLVPIGASAAEIWSTADLLKTVAEARAFKPDVDVRIVWNRFRQNTREARELSGAVRNEFKLPELETRLGYRVAYSEALARGLSADEWLDRNAHAEITALAVEVLNIVEEKKR